MNCLEFRRRTMEDIARSAPMDEHARDCGACRAFAARMRAQDAQIAGALDIPVPDNLAARILFAQRSAESVDADFEEAVASAAAVAVPVGLSDRILERVQGERDAQPDLGADPDRVSANGPSIAQSNGSSAGNVERLTRRAAVTRFALAASIAVGVATAALVGISHRHDPQLVDHLIAHVEDEPWLLDADTLLTRGDLEPVLRTVGVDLDGMPGEVVKAFPCPFRPTPTLHMVIRGTHDKVTVVVMPGDKPADLQTGRAGELHGLVMPVRHGSIGIVGDPREDLVGHAERVRKMLRWRL